MEKRNKFEKKVSFGKRELRFALFDEAGESVLEEVFMDKGYMFLEDLIGKAELILDLGGHIGAFSIYAAALNPDAKIEVFEPDERNFTFLRENLKSNRIRNVKAKNVAIGGTPGRRRFFKKTDSHNHSLLGEGENTEVEVRAFNDLLRDKVDLVKMDVEGAEYEILSSLGADDFKKVRHWCIEYHEKFGHKKQELRSVLEKNVFRVREFPSRYEDGLGLFWASGGDVDDAV